MDAPTSKWLEAAHARGKLKGRIGDQQRHRSRPTMSRADPVSIPESPNVNVGLTVVEDNLAGSTEFTLQKVVPSFFGGQHLEIP